MWYPFAEQNAFSKLGHHHPCQWSPSMIIILNSFFFFFQIQIPFSCSSRMAENEVRIDNYFLLFLKPILVTFLVMAEEEYCAELICLNYTVKYVGKQSDFYFWRDWSCVGLIYLSAPQRGCAVTSRQCTSHHFVVPHLHGAHMVFWKMRLSYGWSWKAVSLSFAASECWRVKSHKGTIFCVVRDCPVIDDHRTATGDWTNQSREGGIDQRPSPWRQWSRERAERT